MAKSARMASPTVYHKVTPIGRRRLDPYNSVFVAVGDSYIIDSNLANALADMGEVEILEENVTPAWDVAAVDPTPAPMFTKLTDEKDKKHG